MPAPGPEHDERLSESIKEADELLRTFRALLRIVQVESGARRKEFGDVNLEHVITDVVEFYEPLAIEKNLTLCADIQANPPFRGDQDLISQALSNLVDNAIKYSPEGAAVTVTLADGPRGPRLVVADSGQGIPADKRERVFDRFYRLEVHRDSEGSGLGLSLVAAIARLHNAAIELENNKPGLRAVLDFRSGNWR